MLGWTLPGFWESNVWAWHYALKARGRSNGVKTEDDFPTLDEIHQREKEYEEWRRKLQTS